MSASSVMVVLPSLGILSAMTVPGFKALLAPSRNLKVTVPGVVGVHSSVVGLPAVMEKPSGILNALSFVWASTDDNRTATTGRIESFILSFCTRIAVYGRRKPPRFVYFSGQERGYKLNECRF